MKILPETWRSALLAVGVGVATVVGNATEVPIVTPENAAALVATGGAVLVDVREPSEWQESGVAAPALLLAKSDFDGDRKDWAPFLESIGDRQVILYCRTGRRSGIVADALAALGLKVANAGGFAEWRDAGLPIRKVEPAPDTP